MPGGKGKVRVHARAPKRVPAVGDVPRTGRASQWLLCLEARAGQSTRVRRSTPAGHGQASMAGERDGVWLPQDLRRPARPGRDLQQAPDRKIDASGRAARPTGSWPAARLPWRRTSDSRTQQAGPAVRRSASRSPLGDRYHLHPDARRLAGCSLPSCWTCFHGRSWAGACSRVKARTWFCKR